MYSAQKVPTQDNTQEGQLGCYLAELEFAMVRQSKTTQFAVIFRLKRNFTAKHSNKASPYFRQDYACLAVAFKFKIRLSFVVYLIRKD